MSSGVYATYPVHAIDCGRPGVITWGSSICVTRVGVNDEDAASNSILILILSSPVREGKLSPQQGAKNIPVMSMHATWSREDRFQEDASFVRPISPLPPLCIRGKS